MTQHSETYFEIFDGGDLIRVETYQAITHDSAIDWDLNWIKTRITIRAGVFNGQYIADFLTTDFELLKRDLKKLYKDLNGAAKFEPREGQLKLNFLADGLGHFEIKCIAQEEISFGARISFELHIDQTELPRLIYELDKITKAFPILGDMTLKNE
jgi:hypothetical protein